jgi:hypothetical protein
MPEGLTYYRGQGLARRPRAALCRIGQGTGMTGPSGSLPGFIAPPGLEPQGATAAVSLGADQGSLLLEQGAEQVCLLTQETKQVV